MLHARVLGRSRGGLTRSTFTQNGCAFAAARSPRRFVVFVSLSLYGDLNWTRAPMPRRTGPLLVEVERYLHHGDAGDTGPRHWRPQNARARSLRDVFGWSRPFEDDLAPRAVLRPFARRSGFGGNRRRLEERCSVLDVGRPYFVQSSYPTGGTDDVFFGLDTLRFYASVEKTISPAARVVDLGCETGAAACLPAQCVKRLSLRM